MPWPFKILVKYASRGRRQRFFEGMDTIYSLADIPTHVFTLITADEDDSEMNNDEVKERIKAYPNTEIIYGTSTGKINAINRDFDKIPGGWEDWDIICNFSDDMRWCIFGWDTMIRVDFNSVSPDLTHFMAYLDQDTKGVLSTLYISGRKFFDLFGWVYNPIYLSLFADNEVEDIAKMMGRYHYTGYTIYKHLLAAYGHLPEDEMYRKQQDIGWSIDEKTYYERKANNFFYET